MDINYYWSGDKDGRRRFAQKHTTDMAKNASAEIHESVNHTKIYSSNDIITFDATKVDKVNIHLEAYGTVDAIYEYAQGKNCGAQLCELQGAGR